MGSRLLVHLATAIAICSGTSIPGDQEQDLISVMTSMLQKVENVSAQIQEHGSKMQDLIEGTKDRLTKLELGLDFSRETLPSEPLKDLIESAVMNGLRNISQMMSSPSTTIKSSPRLYYKGIPKEAGKFYCDLYADGKVARGSCYFLSSVSVTWSSARKKCSEMGAEFARIDTDEEFTFLEKETVGDAWIGLSDLQVEGQYKWEVDGSLHDVKNSRQWWTDGEPNNHNANEHCIHFWHRHHLLNDAPCGQHKRYYCEMLYKEKVSFTGKRK